MQDPSAHDTRQGPGSADTSDRRSRDGLTDCKPGPHPGRHSSATRMQPAPGRRQKRTGEPINQMTPRPARRDEVGVRRGIRLTNELRPQRRASNSQRNKKRTLHLERR
jgi:hypothetical protein